MTIINPTLVLTYTEDNTTATLTSSDIVINSISMEKQLLKDLEPSSNKVALTITRSCSEVENIIACESDIKAVLKNNGTTMFTGYLSTDYSWTVTSNGEQALAITIEDVGTRLLEKEFISSGYHTFNCTVQAAVLAICTTAGIQTASTIVYPIGNVIRGIEGAVTCKDLLSSLLGEFNSVYYFNAEGKLLIHEVSCTSTTGITEFDKTKLYSEVKLTKKIRQYKNARINYTETATASNYLIYRNTTQDQEGGITCYLSLASGEHFDGTEKYTPQAGVTRSPAYIEAVNASSEESLVGSREILAVTSATTDTSGTGGTSATVSVAGGKYLQIDARNEGSSSGYFSKLDVKGSIIYVKTNNVILTADEQVATTQSNNILEEELVWVHTKTLAQKRANLLAQFHRYGGSTYTFYSTTYVALGSIVRLHEDAISGLDVNVMVIASKETDESDIIKYTAIGVSVFDLTAEVSESKTGEGASAESQTPKTVSITRQFAVGSSSSTAPISGWTSDRADITPTSVNPYIWVRETIVYSDGTSVIGTPYVGEVYIAAEVQEFSFTVSPYSVIKNLRKSGSQYLALVANISGYTDYILNYKVNNDFICSIYEKATEEVAEEPYYTFAQTTDRTVQPGKTYYTRSGSNPNWIYTECVNLTEFTESYTSYYERTTVSYSSGVYACSFNAHTEILSYGIPYNNAFSDTITIEMYNGSVYVQEVKLSVNDETEYNKCAGVIQTDTLSMPQTISGQSLVVGDFVVFAVDKTAWRSDYKAGEIAYINNSGQWAIAKSNEKTEEKLIALQKLTEAGINLSDLNTKSVIQWFSEIVAASVNAEYIGSKEIKVLSGGAIYGGNYVKDAQTGEIKADTNIPEDSRTGFYINADGKIEAINAKFSRLTVDKDSTIKGRLECGNENDIMIKTVFTTDTTEGKQYLASHTTTADGFSWSEAHNYISTRVDTPSATPWNVVGADESTLQNLTVKTASGTVNGSTVDKVVYTTTPIATNRIYASQGVNTGGETQNKTTSFTNCMPVPISLNYNFHQGYAFWFAVFSWGAEYPSCQYTITHTDSTTTTVVLCQNATSRSQSDFIDTISLLAGETITWAFGHIGAPAASWNNGVESSTLELTWSLGLSTGFTFYNNGVASVMPTTGYYDLTASDNGLLNLQIPTGTNIISLPHTSAAWSYTGVNKYFKFMHSFNGSSTINAVLYSSFTRCDSLYIQDRYGNIHGVSTTPSTSLLNTISISSGEFAFSYNGVSYSQIAYDPNHPSANTVEYWVRDYSVAITVPSTIKGIYTASIYPRDANSDLGATGSGKYRALHVVTANADVVNAGTTNATAIVTSDISSSSNIQISTIVPKTSTASLGTSSSQFKEVRATEVYENNARVFSTNQIVFSSSYNLTDVSIGQIGIFTGTPYTWNTGSSQSPAWKAKVVLPSGGTFKYTFNVVGDYSAFRNVGYSESAIGGSDVIVSNGTASNATTGRVSLQLFYWRIS